MELVGLIILSLFLGWITLTIIETWCDMPRHY